MFDGRALATDRPSLEFPVMNYWTIPGRFDFSVPEAQWISDLNGIAADLEASARLCKRFLVESKRLSKLPETDHGAWIEEFFSVGDIFFSAIVRYGRTFTSGTRSGIPSEWIAALSEEQQESHHYFKTLRDKFIAHSVNRLEDNQVFVVLKAGDDGGEVPDHIMVDRGRLLMPSHEEVEALNQLCTQLLARVEGEITMETERLLCLAKTIPVEELKTRGTEAVPIPKKEATFQVRKGFK